MTSLEAAYAGIVDRLRIHSSAAERHLTRPEGLELVMASVPDWWSARGNRLFAPLGCSVVLREHPGIAPPSDAIVIVGPDCLAPAEIMLWGDAPAVLLGPSCRLPNGHIHCGGGSTIVIAGYLASINAARLSARNGGLITVGIDNLWGHGVAIQTDDMHAILDARTQRRVNRFGSLVEIGKHV